MNDVVESKKAKDRSPTFPFIPLEKALDRVRQFFAEEKRGVAPYTRAVMHWGYSEASSGGLQTVSALKSYGLLNEPGGSGKSRQLQLSDLALRIHLDQRPESHDRLEYIRQAARTPTVAAEVYAKWQDELPSDSTLNHFLVLEKKFNETTAVSAVKILKENQAFAKLDVVDVLSLEEEKGSDDMNEQEQVIRSIPPGDVLAAAGMARAPKLITAGEAKQKPQVHTEQHLHLDGRTTITLHFSDTPTAAVYKYLSDITAFKAAQLAAVEAKAEAAGQTAQ